MSWFSGIKSFITTLFNFGTIIGSREDLSDDQVEKLAQRLCGPIEGLLKNATLEMEPTLKSIIGSEIGRMLSEIQKDNLLAHGQIHEQVGDLIKILEERISQNDSNAITAVKEILNKTEANVAAELQELNEHLQLDTRKTLVCCEEILTQIRWGNEHIEELATLVKENSKGIATIGDKVEALKEIVLSFLRFAEKQHEEYQSARAVMKQRYEKLSSPGLDAQTITDMHEWLQELSGKSVEEIKKSIDEKSSELTQKIGEISGQLGEIEVLVKKYGQAQKDGQERLEEQLSQKAGEILQREAKLYGLALDIKGGIEAVQRQIDNCMEQLADIKREIRNLVDEKAKLEQTGADPEKVDLKQKKIDGLAKEVDRLSLTIDTLLETIAILQSNGKQEFHKEICPFCQVEERRPAVGTQCECLVCGNIFTIDEPIDPNMSGISDERVQKDAMQLVERHRREKRSKNKYDGEDWRTRHTVELERVSGDQNKFLYRMKWPLHACEDGILIIPSKDNAGEKITTIDFCQPNTDDEEGRERLSKVKKLFLSAGIKIGRFNDVPPFSEISELDKVMTQTDIGFTENEEQRKKIKGAVANDA